jgi:prostaglandin-H2 D-isomerase / glutathione transferase
MPNYKLHYFNATARADLIRLLFAVSGIDFEDHRIELDEWPAVKPTTPLGLHSLHMLRIRIVF